MPRKVMIACALTGAADTPGKNPAVPVSPKQIAESGIEAAKAGAAIVHIHVRNPQTTGPSMELAHYKEVVDRIRDSGTDVVINLTTGAGARFIPGSNDPMVPDPRSTMSTPAQRVRHVVELKPEICSLDMGSINMGNYAFVNTVPHIEEMAIAIRDAGVTPEIEVFEPGHILLAKRMIQTGHFKTPTLFQICLGVTWGTPATPDAMKFMRDLLPPTDNTWFTFGCAAQQFPMVAQAMLYGGHVRVGLEDNLYLSRGKLAPSNAALVEKAVDIIEAMGEELATPAEARQMLGLRKAA
ncbi:MAG TPA: 3-keto-5-aminohexanoate cleavage protein [Stellaceae bacterium]|nr:3-keto-5-aminohexanoate cleavage protein [Stellaceae bacterium]